MIFCGSQNQNPQESSDPSLLTLDRIFSSREFSGDRIGDMEWDRGGDGYLVLENSQDTDRGRNIVRYDVETGEREVLVTAAQLVPKGESAPLVIEDYAFSSDMKYLLILTNSRREFHKTFGDYWIFALENETLRKLGRNTEPSSLMNAALSRDGRKIAYISKNNIFVENVDRTGKTQLTFDGSDDIYNGAFDYVYEEEFFIVHGIRWSPDSRSIAYWQLDAREVPTFTMINNTDSLYPRLIPFKFSKPGTNISKCRIGFVSAQGGPARWFKVTGDPSNRYIPQMDWTGNNQEIIFQHLNRLQNRNEVMLANIRTGRVKPLITDSDEAWVHVVPEIHWLDNGNKFLWMSEQDGWRHLYLVSYQDGAMQLLTPGDFDVESVEGIDESDGWLYFIASPENPTQRYLYRIPLDGSGNSERVTPAGQSGTHSYRISPNIKWAFHTYSRFTHPPVTELIRLPSHEVIRTLADNSELSSALASLKTGAFEFIRVDIGEGVELDAWMMRPPDFEPQKKYPVLFYVYGEPWGSTVRDSWGGTRYLWHLMLTQQGYIVMSIDNRGTRVPRGRAWRKIIYRQVGILASADQAAAVRAIIGRWDYVDPQRIGIWGRSGGGAMTLNAILRYPDLYHTGMSAAPVTDQKYYNCVYQERYMGLPEDNKEGYEQGSPVTFASRLKGNLLLIHGTGDDNVHYQNTEALVNALIRHNKPFTMMSYPNRSHGIREGQNTTLHLYALLTRYLKDHLPPGLVKR